MRKPDRKYRIKVTFRNGICSPSDQHTLVRLVMEKLSSERGIYHISTEPIRINGTNNDCGYVITFKGDKTIPIITFSRDQCVKEVTLLSRQS